MPCLRRSTRCAAWRERSRSAVAQSYSARACLLNGRLGAVCDDLRVVHHSGKRLLCFALVHKRDSFSEACKQKHIRVAVQARLHACHPYKCALVCDLSHGWLRQGEAVTGGLRRVTDDMKTKNRADRLGMVPSSAGAKPCCPAYGTPCLAWPACHHCHQVRVSKQLRRAAADHPCNVTFY